MAMLGDDRRSGSLNYPTYRCSQTHHLLTVAANKSADLLRICWYPSVGYPTDLVDDAFPSEFLMAAVPGAYP